MSKKLNIKLFSKYYWGIATEKEKEEVYNSKESLSMLKEQWDNYSDQERKQVKIDHNKVTSVLNRKIAESKQIRKINKLGAFLIKHAASILIPVIAIGTLYFFLVMQPGIINNISQVEKVTPRGERSELLLPDGTKVWLNAETKIKYPEKFFGKYRIIELDGEAFFDVVKNPKKPFIVKTNKIDIEVLGTSFNVSSYSNDKFIETTLVRGKVRISRKNPNTLSVQKAILTPNHQAIFYKEEEKLVLDKVDVTNYTSWKQGIITFDNEPFCNMVNVLERWYNVDIKIDPELIGKYNYTLTITDESLEEVLTLIKKTTPKVTIKRNKNIIEFKYD